MTLLLPLGRTLVRGLFALPERAIAVLAGRSAGVGADLHPDARLLARVSGTAQPIDEVPLDRARRRFEVRAALMALRPKLPVVATGRALPGPAGSIPARLYVPAAAPTPGPLLVYFHGGGWVQGSLASHDASCRLLAHLAGVRVLSVDYRLAPEHRFPAAVDDAVAAYAHVAARPGEFGADPQRLAVGGDSAGGNLAAVTALSVRDDERIPSPAFQLLIYPSCDLANDHPSETLFAEGFFLTKRSMDWYRDQYVPDIAQQRDPLVSPLLAGDLSGLAPAYVATCLTDPLRDEGEAYADRLRSAGVPVSLERHPLLHGFFNMSATRSGRAALAVLAGALQHGLAAKDEGPVDSGPTRGGREG